MMVPITTTMVPNIQTRKSHLARRARSCDKLCAGSPMAPKVAISAAPAQVRIVPTREYRVKGSFSSMVAKRVLKTKPEACSVERTGKGRVVIWMVLPTKLEMTNMNIPICHLRRL